MTPSPATTFDFWTLLFSGFAFIGLFYSIKLLVTKVSGHKSRILGLYVLLQSIALLEYVFYWTKLIYAFPALIDISLLFPFLYGPILVIYFNRSFGNDKPIKSYVYHFIPFALLLLLKIPFYLAPANLKLYHTHDILFGKYFEYYPWWMLLHLGVYCVILVVLVRSYSGVGSMRLWAKWLIGFFASFILLSFMYHLLSYTQALTPQSDYFISLATCATIALIGWYGHGFDAIADGKSILDSLIAASTQAKSVSQDSMIIEVSKQNEAAPREGSGMSEAEKYRHSALPKSLSVKLANDLENLMQREKLYHQNDLRLEVLAAKLNTSKHFVSQVINQGFKMNFFEYINLKRIEEAKHLLRTTPREELNIIEVAYTVGFNNKGTFNSAFKKITGVTPTEFRRQSKQLLNPSSN